MEIIRKPFRSHFPEHFKLFLQISFNKKRTVRYTLCSFSRLQESLKYSFLEFLAYLLAFRHHFYPVCYLKLLQKSLLSLILWNIITIHSHGGSILLLNKIICLEFAGYMKGIVNLFSWES